MTADKEFKRLIRRRARRTGESYVRTRRLLLANARGSEVTNTDQPRLAGLSGLMIETRELPEGFELKTASSGPINRFGEGPDTETRSARKARAAAETAESTKDVSGAANPTLIGLGLRGGYVRVWDEANRPEGLVGQRITHHLYELESPEAAQRLTVGRSEKLRARPDFEMIEVDEDGVCIYRKSLADAEGKVVATMTGATYAVDRMSSEIFVVLRSSDEATTLIRALAPRQKEKLALADPAGRLPE